ncbi:helix-turn-helix transcriptional regulator [Halomonas sp. AOP35-4E-18]|uniref:helix-turn-helix transcriptional regulator n=1 Tax=Halomonas sp. AOP35-4E-18 TaxID=3457686 RepID=UPI00403453AB
MSITIITPPKTDTTAMKPGHQLGVSHIDPRIKLMTGTYFSASEEWYEEPLEQGVRLILVQSGRLRCRIPGQPEQLIKGPMLCTIANGGDFTSAQVYSTDQPLRYTIVQLCDDVVDSRLGWLPELLRPRPDGDPLIMSYPAPRTIQALASQIATCQMGGPTRDLYLGGKALELAALSAQFLFGETRLREERRITSSEVERIHAARDILVSALQEPPTLEQLALRVGMNRRKLTAGFRKVFDTSVFGYLQEYRLREAHRMLCDEEFNVSTVAYRVGYSPAHFAIAFRRRYGVSPSKIR